MQSLDALRESLPDYARDIKINLGNVLTPGVLDAAQCYGVAIACARAVQHPVLENALIAAAREAGVVQGVIDDAHASAVLMAMNNVAFRFRHTAAKEDYKERPLKLRMQRINTPSSSKANLELFSLAVSTINFCEACVNAHEEAVRQHGMSMDHVMDAVRIAATIAATAVAMPAAQPTGE